VNQLLKKYEEFVYRHPLTFLSDILVKQIWPVEMRIKDGYIHQPP